MKKVMLFIAVVLLASCNSKPLIVGKWIKENGDGKTKDTSIECFKSNGKYEGLITVRSGHVFMESSASGTYELKDDSVIIHVDTIKVDGEPYGRAVVRRRIVQVNDTIIEFSDKDNLLRYKRVRNEEE